ncbi:MAG: hypothetical protein K6A69_06630 [Lachnospiraceae bacterium]|nr:hypothetical protein [Lachnospiraceae bacterium]
MNKSILKRLSAVVMIFSLLFMNTSFISYAEEEKEAEESQNIEQTVTVNSAKDLRDLANACRMSSFSKGILVELGSDIDLSGEEDFSGIDSFSGIFDGKGHSITGFEMDYGDGAIGFFGFVEEGAVIKNLTMESDITSDDNNNYLGALAGVNAGTISNCTSKGVISGTGHAGGITGLNGGNGIIENCTNEATVYSLTFVGGIAGENRGQIDDSVNKGEINADNRWLSLEDDSVTSLSIDSIIENFTKTVDKGKDIGGIAGYSTGMLNNCENSGVVGYQHAGKNVGGIAGRFNGMINGCKNTGKVYGKQDVGGIAGQFEPTILEEGEDLTAYINELQGLSTKLVNDTSAAGVSAESTLRDISDDAATVGQNINDSLNSTSGAITSGIYNYADSSKQRLDAAASSITSLQSSIATQTDDAKNAITELDYNSVLNQIEYLNGQMAAAGNAVMNYDVNATAGSIASGIDNAAQNSSGAVNSAVSSIGGDVSEVTGNVTGSINNLANTIESTRVTLTNDINAINNKISDITSLADEQAENLRRISEGGDIIEDYSAVDSENEKAARIVSCQNTGYVNGDRNVGGIAGNLAIEGKDSQDEESEDGSKYVTLAVLEDSESNGIIELRKEHGGGIAGNSDLGLIRNCSAKDRIISEEGNYVGGVAGYAKGTVSDCTSSSYISGSSYIGGICGAGKKVRSCYSLTEMDVSSGWMGAVIGDVINDSSDDITVAHSKMMNSIYDNYYTNDIYGGINDVNYDGIASPLEYDALINSPKGDAFRDIYVYFYDTDYNLIKKAEVNYGDDLNMISYPELNMGDGVYLIWKGLYSTSAKGNTFLIADESDNVTAISSNLTRNDKPVALISGMFYENTVLHAEEVADEKPVSDEELKGNCFVYKVSLMNEPAASDQSYKVRLYTGDMKNPAVYEKTDDKWSRVEHKAMGSYAEVALSGNSAVYAVADVGESFNYAYVIIAVAALLIIVVATIIIVKKKKKS